MKNWIIIMIFFLWLYILSSSHNITPSDSPKESNKFFSCQSMTHKIPEQTLSSWLSEEDTDNYTEQFVGMKPLRLDPEIQPRSDMPTYLPNAAVSEATLEDPTKLNTFLKRQQPQRNPPGSLAPTQPPRYAQQPSTITPKPITKNNSSDDFVVVEESIGNLIREHFSEKHPHIPIPTIQSLSAKLTHTPTLEGMNQEQFVEYIPLITLFLLHNDQDYTNLNSHCLPEQDFEKFLNVLYNNDPGVEALRQKEVKLIQQWICTMPFISMKQMKILGALDRTQRIINDTASSIYTALANLVHR